MPHFSGESQLRCRINNRPDDIFGTWFSDNFLISGNLHWLAHLVSTSVLWLNKANQEIHSEHVPIMNQLYKFYNKNASYIHEIMVANGSWFNDVVYCDDKSDEDHEYSETEHDVYVSDDDLENACPKCLIFSMGSKTYIPHQVGLKLVRSVNFPKILERGPSLKERIAAKKREQVRWQ